MRTNYHTHTERCNHATGLDEEYVLHAINGGFDILGFSDHTPWNFSDGYKSRIRMGVKELDEYVASIERLRDKYRDKIDIKIGLECEYFPDHIEWLKEQKERLGIEYLIFGNHFPYYEKKSFYFGNTYTKAELEFYVKTSIEAIESGVFDYFAHPELFMRSYPFVDNHCKQLFRELCCVSSDSSTYFEFNTSLSYVPELWEIVAEEKPKVVVGLDCHDAKLLSVSEIYDDSVKLLKSLGIEPIMKLEKLCE